MSGTDSRNGGNLPATLAIVVAVAALAVLWGCLRGAQGLGQPRASADDGAPAPPKTPPGDWRAQVNASLPPHMKPSDISILDTLPALDFLPEGARLFVVGVRAVGEPSPYERMCFESKGASLMVVGPESLAGRVVIRTPAGALRYARLFTSASTGLCFPTSVAMLEVVPASAVTPEYLFGRHGVPFPDVGGPRWTSGWYGIVSNEDWAAGGLPAAAARKTEAGFVVSRCLFGYGRQAKRGTVYQVEETISRDGALSRRVTSERQLDHPVPCLPALM